MSDPEFPAETASATPRSGCGDSRLRMLLAPASTGADGSALDLPTRAALEAWIDQAARALGAILSRRVSVRAMARAAGTDEEGPVFLVQIEASASTERVCIVLGLDHRAARAIADALEASMAGLRGAGELSEAERGLLEYATLSVLDHVAGKLGPGSQVSLGDFPHTRSFAGLTQGLVRHTYELHVAAASGDLELWLPASLPSVGEPRAQATRSSQADDIVEVGLALPPIWLEADACKALRSGDALTLGYSDLRTTGVELALATRTGWHCARARFVSEDTTHVHIEVQDLDPRPLPSRDRAGRSMFWPLLGSAKLALDELESLRAGDRLHLTKHPAPILVLGPDAEAWEGELASYEGELAVGLLGRVR